MNGNKLIQFELCIFFIQLRFKDQSYDDILHDLVINPEQQIK